MNYYIITGTSSGIGNALARELLKYVENRIIGISRSNTIFEDHFQHINIDLSDLSQVKNLDLNIPKDAKKVVLVNNAGTLGEIEYVGQQSNQNVATTINVNFTAAALLMNQFIQKTQDLAIEKVIINISSGAANSAYDGWANYCSSKAALNMYTEVIHKEQQFKKYPVQVFAIAPGVVDTYMQDQIRSSNSNSFSQIEKFKTLKEEKQLFSTFDVAKYLVNVLNDVSKIPSLISRIHL